MPETTEKTHQLPFELLCEVCSIIQDTGYIGSAESYIKEFYGKDFSQLTACEAEMIVRQLGNKPGCLYEGDPKDLVITPIPPEEE